MSTTTMTQVPAGVQASYDKNLLMRAVALFVHDRFGQQRNLPQKESKSIKFRRYGNLSAATTGLTEGVTPAGSQLSVTDLTATVVQYGDYVTLTDQIQMHVEDNVVMEATDILGDQAGDTLDQVWRDAIIPNLANSVILTAAGASTTEGALVAADVMKAKNLDVAINTLKNNKAKKFTSMIGGSTKVGTTPIRAAYMGIVHPDVTYDMENITGYKNVVEYAAYGDIQEGEVGAYKDIRFIETTNAYINVDGGDTNVDAYHTGIFGKEAYGIVSLRGKKKFETYVKPLGSAGTADPINQRSTVGWKASTVAKILNDAFAVSVITAATLGDN